MTDKKKYILFCIISIFMLCAVSACGILMGSVKLNFSQLLDGFTKHDSIYRIIIYDMRLPRVIGAALCGAALACSGLALQCVTANDLCAPNIIGINSGAGFFVIVVLAFIPRLWRLLPFFAFCGALFTAFAVIAISNSVRNRSGSVLVLSGVAVSSVFNAAISFCSLKYPDILSSYTAFSVGGFSSVSYDDITIPGIIIVISLFALQFISPKLSLLYLGDDIASSLGVRVRYVRTLTIVISAALCASAVSFAGLLGFVGLIVPHIVRKIMGEDMRFNVSLTAICGAVLVIFSDLAGRVIFSPTELPAGIIMSLVGAPFFLFILIARGKKNDRM
ncbi:MAG: iron ABC transporter permease [Clostridia bacterium]|nr:iron ABC transporter permease [Clostridia bacterium]